MARLPSRCKTDPCRLDSVLERPNVEYLLKPYDGATLLATMREVMRGSV